MSVDGSCSCRISGDSRWMDGWISVSSHLDVQQSLSVVTYRCESIKSVTLSLIFLKMPRCETNSTFKTTRLMKALHKVRRNGLKTNLTRRLNDFLSMDAKLNIIIIIIQDEILSSWREEP